MTSLNIHNVSPVIIGHGVLSLISKCQDIVFSDWSVKVKHYKENNYVFHKCFKAQPEFKTIQGVVAQVGMDYPDISNNVQAHMADSLHLILIMCFSSLGFIAPSCSLLKAHNYRPMSLNQERIFDNPSLQFWMYVWIGMFEDTKKLSCDVAWCLIYSSVLILVLFPQKRLYSVIAAIEQCFLPSFA